MTDVQPRWQPWQGKKYLDRSSGFGLQVLILGESHYSREKDPKNLTVRAIEYHRAPQSKKPRTFSAIERTLQPLLGDSVVQDDVWDHVAFYNYIQTWVAKKPNERFRRSEYKKKENSEALNTILRNIAPDLVIILGKGLFKWLSDVPGPPVRVGRVSHPTWQYQTKKGKTAFVIGIKHPGKFYRAADWRPLIEAGIKAAAGT